MVSKEYQNKEVIFKEHEYQKWMYSICEGAVDVYSRYGTSAEKKLATLTEGQYFGEIGMIGMMPRTATAVAAADHVVLELISYDDFEGYLKNHPENVQPIMSNVSRRIRGLTDDLSEITQITNEALGKGQNTDSKKIRLAEFVRRLVDKLNAGESFEDDCTIRNRKTRVICGEIPPVFCYRAGDVIFYAGDEADCMYEICDGRIGIYSDYKTKNEKLLTELHAEDVFGEMGVLDNMARSATAVCLTDCCVLMVRKEHFMLFFRKKPMKVLRILQHMCERLRELTKMYLQVCKTLKELPSPEKKDFEEDLAWIKLECFYESQMNSGMYDISSSTNWMSDC